MQKAFMALKEHQIHDEAITIARLANVVATEEIAAI